LITGSSGLSSTARSSWRHRLLEPAEPVVGPAEAVDDVAVIGAELDRALQHRLGLNQVHALVDPAVAEIVENQGLLRLQLEGGDEIRLGLGPAIGALPGDAAGVEQRPVADGDLRQSLQGAVIGALGIAVALLAAANVPHGDQGVDPLRPLGGHGLEFEHRLVLAIQCR
jgi:hypothetical protein